MKARPRDSVTNTDAPRSSNETDSFLKRLAGPSTGKAGLAKDQSEINRIIAEASKGSKYYNNEKRRDQELTEKINALLILRDDLLLNSNISKVEHDVDRLLSQLDAERDLSQIIVHVDMDAFFANVELLDNPSLAGKPFGVGHGVLTTASYEARKFGVRSGMATHIARKLCPELIITSISHGRYSEMSDKVFNVLRRYDPTLFAAGCDEGYLNITAYCKEHDLTASDCVQQIRKTVYEETSLTASAGIAPNLICSDRNKPNGQFELTCDPQAITEFMRELPIRRIPGIGRVSERLLDSIGVKTCGDIYKYRATISLLDKQFGLEGLLKKYLGIGSNVVQPWQREERKSIGAERTFHSLSEKDKILGKLDEIAAELAGDMERHGFAAKTITLKYKLHTYEVFTRAKSCDRWITKKDDLYAVDRKGAGSQRTAYYHPTHRSQGHQTEGSP
ncbi:hypothetical protein DL96DRAFT_1669405 [Flagelloscypha sp. PMI_526]|nr:hypothetical protein DL96DRAFT_1669405 [Flagelloscypha sp. PMI_526]